MVAYLFSDGFESGNFNAWSGTARSSGETTTVVSSPKQDGAYSAMFTSNGGGGYENSYASKTITSINELYARGYFYISQSGIQSNGAHIYLIMLRAGTDNVAFAGWQMTGGVVKWVLMIRSGTGYAGPVFSSASPSMNTWYRVEIHWKLGTSDGSAELYIDGNLNLSITNRNTASYGGVTSVRFGLPELYSCASTIAYADSCVIDDALIGLGSASSQMRPSVQALATDASTVQNSFPDKPSAD
jgi:hypothetical protein